MGIPTGPNCAPVAADFFMFFKYLLQKWTHSPVNAFKQNKTNKVLLVNASLKL